MEALKRYPSVLNDIADDDPMYVRTPLNTGDLDRSYHGHGRVMLDCIRVAMIAAKKESAERILDLPSGHGRALRYLQAEYPEADLTACDIIPGAVEFCAETFGATPVYGKDDPADIELGTYDLIWCGSLVTHVDAPRWDDFLDLFENALEPGGLLVFSFSGRHIAASLSDPAKAGNFNRTLDNEEERRRFFRDYETEGFAYCDYPDWPGYGTSLAKASWVMKKIEDRDLQVVSFSEGRWGAMDVLGVVRTPIEAQPTRGYLMPLGGTSDLDEPGPLAGATN
jgi:SAM-dependent methyltransferase